MHHVIIIKYVAFSFKIYYKHNIIDDHYPKLLYNEVLTPGGLIQDCTQQLLLQ